MATLYWGGGTGTWDGFTTTNWYTDLARTVLAGRAPAADDDVIFDSTSNATAYTVTFGGSTDQNAAVCRSCTISPPGSGNITLAGSRPWFIYGSLTLPASRITRTYTGTINFYATDSRTITMNGVTFGSSINFSGTGTYTLQDAFNNGTSAININAGILNTNGKTLTCGNISATTGTTAGTLNLGASSVNASTISANAPLTITSSGTITLSSASPSIGGGTNYTGNTLHNVTFSSSVINSVSILGNNTFNNVFFFEPPANKCTSIRLFGNQTINGTLTINQGATSSYRYFIHSDTIGTARTLTVAAVGTLGDVDFRDITIAGASSPWSGTRLGDCKGNTNITFVAGANKYIAAGTVTSNWSENIWAASSGGAAAPANFPLAQDTVIIDNAGLNTGESLTINSAYNIGGFDASSRTNAMTLSGVTANIYGDFNVSTNVTTSLSGSLWVFAGRNTQNITSNGKTLFVPFVNSPGGTVKLIDNFSCGTSGAIQLLNGTFDANNKDITCGSISASGSASKTLTLGSGTITTTNGFGTVISTVSNLTVTSNTATITCSGSSLIGFDGITASFGGTITVSGSASSATIAGTTTIANLTIGNAPTTTSVTTKLQLGGNLTVSGTLALAGGTSVTQRAFVRSNTLGTQRTLSAATVTGLSDIDFRDINATGAANWTTGTRLGDCGNNAGITFPAAKTVYWNLAGTQNWSATAWATGSGGTPATNNFPLAQDTAVFDNTGSVGTVTIDSGWNIGTISAGGRTSAWTFSIQNLPVIYGDVTYGSGITVTGTFTFTFSGRGTQTYTTAGKTVTNTFAVQKPSGTFQHGDAYTSSSAGAINVTEGTYTTQNYNISAAGLQSSSTQNFTRSVTLGTSTLTLSSTSPITFTNPTNLTFSGASSIINLSNATGTKTFDGGGQQFGTVSSTGGNAEVLRINGSNKFNTLTNTAYSYLEFANGSTQEVANFTYTGIAGNVVRWFTTIPGQRATLKKTGAGIGVGTNSTNGGNNTEFSFTGTSPNYFYIKDMIYDGPAPGSGGRFIMLF